MIVILKISNKFKFIKLLFNRIIINKYGDWGLGIGDWGLGFGGWGP